MRRSFYLFIVLATALVWQNPVSAQEKVIPLSVESFKTSKGWFTLEIHRVEDFKGDFIRYDQSVKTPLGEFKYLHQGRLGKVVEVAGKSSQIYLYTSMRVHRFEGERFTAIPTLWQIPSGKGWTISLSKIVGTVAVVESDGLFVGMLARDYKETAKEASSKWKICLGVRTKRFHVPIDLVRTKDKTYLVKFREILPRHDFDRSGSPEVIFSPKKWKIDIVK